MRRSATRPRRIRALIARLTAPVAILPPLALLAVLLTGCATPPPADDPDAVADFKANNDPLEPTNRVFYVINDGLDTYFLAPVARGYRYVLPQPVRTGIHNFLTNLGSPICWPMTWPRANRAGRATPSCGR